MLKKGIYFLLFTLSFFISCENRDSSSLDQDLNEVYNLDTILSSLSSFDSSHINSITSENGYLSILKWSDSLESKWFITELAGNLKYGGSGIFEVSKHNDSIVVLSLGKQDPIVGATNGYLFLLKRNEIWKIDKFRGGK